MLLKEINTLYPKSYLNHTVNIQSRLWLSRVVGEKNIWTDSERYTTRFHMVAVVVLTFNSLSLLDLVKNMWCVKSKQYFNKFWDKGFSLETILWWWLYTTENMKFPIDLHIKAYDFNHWLLSLHGFKYLHYSVTLCRGGETHFLVFAQTLI